MARGNNKRIYFDDHESKDKEKFYTLFDNIFKCHGDSYIYKKFRSQMNGIAIINTNTVMVDMRRNRKEGTDKESSEWEFYTDLQNRMYKILYENLYIDLNWFLWRNIDLETIQKGVSIYLKFLLNDMPGKWTHENAQKYLSQSHIKCPIQKNVDYTTLNMETHVNRTIGRIGCKTIVTPTIDSELCLRKSVQSNLIIGNDKFLSNNQTIELLNDESIKKRKKLRVE